MPAHRAVFIAVAVASVVALACAQPLAHEDGYPAATTSKSTPEELLEPLGVPSPSGVCVDERYLLALGHTRADFVHRRPILANALCPRGTLPCGTPDHRLRVEGLSMSYAQYCKTAACDRRIMTVNSVYSHVWTEKIHDEAVVTMFDHRYSEVAQMALHWGMRIMRCVF